MDLWGCKDFSMTHMNSKEGQNSNMAAGANAKSRTDMKSFVGSDTLAELVWSPQEGLSIKFADKKPCFMWEGGPSDINGSHKQKATEELSDHLFENGVPSGFNGTGFNIKSHLETEEVMAQCGPEEHFEKAIVKIEKDGFENAQNAILENNKHLYYQENDENKHEIESHGSVESCKSGEGKRSLSFEQQLVFGSKRHKKQNEGCFINWISNMLNDLKNLEKNQSFCDVNRRKMGFQSVFRSLSLPDIDKYNHGSLGLLKIKDKEDNNIVVKHISLYERVTKEAPKGLFDTIRRLRLSRTDILNPGARSMSSLDLDLMNVPPDLTNSVSQSNLADSDSLAIKLSPDSNGNPFPKAELIDNSQFESSVYTDSINRVAKLTRKPVISDSLEPLSDKSQHFGHFFNKVLSFFFTKKPKILGKVFKLVLFTSCSRWTNSRSSFANLDGFFLRLRIAKWEEGAQGSRYYVACIRGLQGENSRGDLKQPICVKVGGVECFVESQYISNCDFLEGLHYFEGRTGSMVAKNVGKWTDSFCERFDIEVSREENIGSLDHDGDFANGCIIQFPFTFLINNNINEICTDSSEIRGWSRNCEAYNELTKQIYLKSEAHIQPQFEGAYNESDLPEIRGWSRNFDQMVCLFDFDSRSREERVTDEQEAGGDWIREEPEHRRAGLEVETGFAKNGGGAEAGFAITD
ncbi:hypothetical protein LXL04_022945 [Taraxacum kok-saghyz]